MRFDIIDMGCAVRGIRLYLGTVFAALAWGGGGCGPSHPETPQDMGPKAFPSCEHQAVVEQIIRGAADQNAGGYFACGRLDKVHSPAEDVVAGFACVESATLAQEPFQLQIVEETSAGIHLHSILGATDDLGFSVMRVFTTIDDYGTTYTSVLMCPDPTFGTPCERADDPSCISCAEDVRNLGCECSLDEHGVAYILCG